MRVLAYMTLAAVMAAWVTSPATASWVWRDGRWYHVPERAPEALTPPEEEPGEAEAPPPPELEAPRTVALPSRAEVAPTPPSPAPGEPQGKPLAPPPPPPTDAPRVRMPTTPPDPEPAPVDLPSPEERPAYKPPELTGPSADGDEAPPWWKFWKKPPSEEQQRLWDKGVHLYQEGDLKGAADALKKLIKDHPTSPYREEAMWLRAEALFYGRDFYKAYEQYEDLIRNYAGSPHYRTALEREVEIAELYLGPARRRLLGMPVLSGESEAIEILRRVYEHEPLGDLADDALLRIADYNWSKGDWEGAQQYYDAYCREFPNGPAVRKAELRRAMAGIQQCRGPRCDTTVLTEAAEQLRRYLAKYPEQARAEGVPEILEDVRELQAQSLYEVALYYKRSGKPLAAARYAEYAQEDYPGSPWSHQAAALVDDIAEPAPWQETAAEGEPQAVEPIAESPPAVKTPAATEPPPEEPAPAPPAQPVPAPEPSQAAPATVGGETVLEVQPEEVRP